MAGVVISNFREEFSYDVGKNVRPRKVEFYSQNLKTIFLTITYNCAYTLHVDENNDQNLLADPERMYCLDLDFEHVSEILSKTEAIREKLTSWGKLNRHQLEEVITFTAEKMETDYYEWPGYNYFDLDFDIKLDHYHDVVRGFDNNGMDGILQRSFEENVVHMVPASAKSIKSLKRKRMTGSKYKSLLLKRMKESSGESCVICLERFLEIWDTICMPCKHEFHGGCIEEWLRVSHYCPICRYEMPTATN